MGKSVKHGRIRLFQLFLLSFVFAALLRMPADAAVKESVRSVTAGSSYTVSGYSSAKSSKTSYATVSQTSSGEIQVTGKKKGRTVITYYNKKGKEAAKEYLIVTDSTSFRWDTALLRIQKGSTAKVKATVQKGCKVAYSSSNPSVATVTSKGKIKAIGRGTATISAKVYYKGTKITTLKKSVKVMNSSVGSETTTIMGNGQTKKVNSRYIRYYNSKGKLVRSIDKKKKMVALTYDDGPASGTTTILNTLKKYNSVATFFVVGNRVSSYSSTVKEEFEMGCEIGNHTWSHATLTSLGSSGIQSQLTQTNDAVKNITGESPVVMRPPGGAYNSTVRSVTKSMGMPIIYWAIDTRDWEHRNATTTYNSVINNVKDGDIVLMHDLQTSTATASQNIIPKLIEKGYQLVTVSELGECRGGLQAGEVYSYLR